jgi:hypothetical protein
MPTPARQLFDATAASMAYVGVCYMPNEKNGNIAARYFLLGHQSNRHETNACCVTTPSDRKRVQ